MDDDDDDRDGLKKIHHHIPCLRHERDQAPSPIAISSYYGVQDIEF